MPKVKKSSLNAAVSKELKANFDLSKFKEKKMLNSNVKFKDQQWIPLSKELRCDFNSWDSSRTYCFT